MRIGFEEHGGRCVFSSEWNNFAQKTYLENFPNSATHSEDRGSHQINQLT
ncbi:DNA cytosine methyltransferase [Desulfosarcina ovata]